MVFPIAGGTQDTSYEIENALRFNRGDSPKVSRSISSSGSARNATLSVWVKRGVFGSRQQIYSNKTADSGFSGMNMYFNASNDRLYIDHHDGSSNISLYTTQVFKDASAWYHIVHTIDTTTGTATNRLRLYINGTEVTDFATDQNPSQNADLALTNSTGDQSIGDDPRDSNDIYSGYMAEFNFVDGTTLDPTYFGETNNNGVWVPKKPDVSSYGTNGFFLEFKQTGTSANSSGIGADTSGNDNHMSVTNLAATDVTTDTPTNNFCTLNPLIGGAVYTAPSYSEGNLKWSSSSNSSFGSSGIGTIAPNSGKWYWESKITSSIINGVGSGARVMEGYYPEFNNDSFFAGNTSQSGGVGYSMNYNNGKPQTNSAETTTNQGNAVSQNDIVGIAMDLDNGAIYYSINGTFQASGDPTSGSSKTNAQHSFTVDGSYAPAVYGYQSSVFEMNFGNAPFSISSGNSDANGYGNFEYSVPSGYYSINTKNLAEFG